MKNELVERYLYDVVRRLPENQRKDIEQELRSLIEDMIAEREEQEEEAGEECVKAVLNELGDPVKLARGYRGENNSLISGEYYDSYCFILKIVLICAGAGILISNIVSAFIHVAEAEQITTGIWNDITNIGNIPMVLIQVFGIITIIYAIMERNHVRVNVNDTAWSLEKLPDIPCKKARISRGESVAGIVFGVLVAVMFCFTPQLMGAWINRDGVVTAIPIFNLAIWSAVCPLFLISVMAGVVDDFVKLVVGRYTYGVMTVTVIMDTISFILTCILFKTFPVWNEKFIPELEKAFDTVISAKGDILTYFNTNAFTNGFLTVLLVLFMIDIGTTVYYTIRYGEK